MRIYQVNLTEQSVAGESVSRGMYAHISIYVYITSLHLEILNQAKVALHQHPRRLHRSCHQSILSPEQYQKHSMISQRPIRLVQAPSSLHQKWKLETRKRIVMNHPFYIFSGELKWWWWWWDLR
jgi:hypothetical protein